MELRNVNSVFLAIFLNFLISQIFALPEEPDFTYYKLYQAGKTAYTEERWFECAAFMRRALEDYKFYRGVLWSCHQRCERHIPTDPFPIDTPAFREEKRAIFDQNSVPEARIFERFVKNALCLRRCKIDRLPGRPTDFPDPLIEKDFRQLKPYSYIQFCYWKVSQAGNKSVKLDSVIVSFSSAMWNMLFLQLTHICRGIQAIR